jgi:hypothetical protein
MLYACLYTICFEFCYTQCSFYAFSRTNLLTRCHRVSSLFFVIFVFQKSYTGNILGIGRNKSRNSYFSRHDTICLILCLQQTGEIDNLTVSWGKVLGCIVCRFHVVAGAKLRPGRGAIFKFFSAVAKLASINLRKLVLSPTGSINLGFILREDLLMCSSYLPLGVSNWAVIYTPSCLRACQEGGALSCAQALRPAGAERGGGPPLVRGSASSRTRHNTELSLRASEGCGARQWRRRSERGRAAVLGGAIECPEGRQVG